MSYHDDLVATVAEQRRTYKKQVETVVSAMGLLTRALPKFFGGTERSYGFRHPVEPGAEGRTALLQQIQPEEGNTFATLLLFEAGANFASYLRFSDFTEGGVTVQLIGWDDITCKLSGYDDQENAARLIPFCQKIYTAARQTLITNPRLADAKIVKLNEYDKP